MEIQIDQRCFKIDKHNAKAMISGYRLNGAHHFQAIYCDVQSKPFPMLITLNRSRTTFTPSSLVDLLLPDDFEIPLKYIAVLDTEYFIENNINLWKELCSNGLFNIWIPESPYRRFNDARSDPSKFRILLLRIFEISTNFDKADIRIASSRIDHLISENKRVNLAKPIIENDAFLEIKNKLEVSVKPYLLSKALSTSTIRIAEPLSHDNLFPDQIINDDKYFEGAFKTIQVNAYERNKNARLSCINHHGCRCSVCSFDFEKTYGARGKEFIHVHHKIPLSEIKEEYQLDPISDLIPVCPNCHAMLHRYKPNMSIEELKDIIQKTHPTKVST